MCPWFLQYLQNLLDLHPVDFEREFLLLVPFFPKGLPLTFKPSPYSLERNSRSNFSLDNKLAFTSLKDNISVLLYNMISLKCLQEQGNKTTNKVTLSLSSILTSILSKSILNGSTFGHKERIQMFFEMAFVGETLHHIQSLQCEPHIYRGGLVKDFAQDMRYQA